MRKYFQVLSVLGILLFLVWLRNFKLEDDVTGNVAANSPTPSVTTLNTPTVTIMPSATSIPQKLIPSVTPTFTPTPIKNSLYKDGAFTGSVQDAYYGLVQVQAIVAGGKITDVVFLQYPNDNRTSQRINSQAMPLLTQEALQSQSANVSGVSGASATSPAFIASLADALSKAKN